jgi:hypothetical protein
MRRKNSKEDDNIQILDEDGEGGGDTHAHTHRPTYI